MGRIIQTHTRKYYRRKSKVRKASNKKGNHKRCPSCGRFM